jgi:CheY-like chemotaxis protein
VLGDASQLTQVFLNLITNAEQAIQEIRDRGTLRIRVASTADVVTATLQDDGVGIRRDILPKIFDPFFTTKRPGRGTGLGLSICLAILREHNGQIEAQPLADGGTVFTVSLPVVKGAETILAPSSVVSAGSDSNSTGRLSGSNVLVVDDEESIRELVRDGLGVRGVRVHDASNGEEALKLLETGSYDAVLCDMNLSGGTPNRMSGRELYECILSRPSISDKPFFLFMTGELVDGATVEGLSSGGTRTLHKPFRISELVAILTEVLTGTTAGIRHKAQPSAMLS